jgi:hypothetical protein
VPAVSDMTGASDTDRGAEEPPSHPATVGGSGPAVERSATSAERNAARQAERRLVVYLDEVQRRWLRGVEADALLDDVRLSASAIVRLAIDELRARHVGWRELAGRLPTTDDQLNGLD